MPAAPDPPSRIGASPLLNASSRVGAIVTALAGVLTAGAILMIHSGRFATHPLVASGLIWHAYLGLAVVGVVVLLGRLSWWRWPVLWFIATWAVFGAWMPYAYDIAPDPALGYREILTLGYCAALSIGILLLGRRAGPVWWRLGWVLGLAFTGAIGVWELVTEEHLWVSPANPFPFRERVAVATFGNPNNFGIVLLSALVAVLAWRASTRHRLLRWFLVGAAVFASVMVLASQSRAAVLGLLVVWAMEARRLLYARPGLVRAAVRRHLRFVTVVAAGVALAVVAAFTVPSLAARNPVLEMIQSALLPETARSDMLRVQLILVALRYLRESGYMGTGAGSFEPIMWNDPHSGIHVDANLHNAFVELLSQYGVVVFAVFGGLMVALVVLAWRLRFSAAMRPQIAAVRTEMLGHLIVFITLAFTASSSLNHPIWWLMLANACANAAWLIDRYRSPAGAFRRTRPRSIGQGVGNTGRLEKSVHRKVGTDCRVKTAQITLFQ